MAAIFLYTNQSKSAQDVIFTYLAKCLPLLAKKVFSVSFFKMNKTTV